MEAIIRVFVYRAGLLARVAHDLRLTVLRHELTVQGRRVHGVCTAKSLAVDGVMTRRGLDKRILSFNDHQMINDAIRSQVLLTETYPLIEFDGEVSGNAGGKLQVRGTLQLCGHTRQLVTELAIEGDHVQASFELTPSQFGIAPFKALGGAIKTQDRVKVSLDIALNGEAADRVLSSSEVLRLVARE